MIKNLCIMSLLSISAAIYSMNNNKNVKSSEFLLIVKPTQSGELGVFAARDLVQGTQLFDEPFDIRVLKKTDIPEEFLNYCIPLNNEECACPERFDRMETGWYMNLSSTHANIAKNLNGVSKNIMDVLKANTFYAIRDIKAGEEILIDVEQVKKYTISQDS